MISFMKMILVWIVISGQKSVVRDQKKDSGWFKILNPMVAFIPIGSI